MTDRLPDPLQTELTARLTYYQDIGIPLFYRHRQAPSPQDATMPSGAEAPELSCTGAALLRPSLPGPTPLHDSGFPSISESSRPATAENSVAVPESQEETMPNPSPKSPTKSLIPQTPSITATSTTKSPLFPSAPPTSTQKISILPPTPKPSLFDAANKIPNDTLLKIREDLGECTRCKLHSTRNKIVFGDGNPKTQLVFVGEGPGRDEDAQGLPFVGRAGKLLTQMIEAMGLQRQDVYIANVVKCRPPENRLPEPDEIKTCSPFLMRQLDAIAPKVIVCLGACSAQTLLETNRGISHFRGQWLDFRGRKLMATYHPAYLLRNPAAKADVWKDLQKVMAELGLELKKGKSAALAKSS
jgi:uracil-DNA glycosylase